MKRKIIRFVSAAVAAATLLTGCMSPDGREGAGDHKTAESQELAEDQEAAGASEPEAVSDAETEAPEEKAAVPATALEDGVYTAEFDTDSSMFHISEACDGKGTLTVENGEMVIHVSLASKNIVNLFPGLAEDARRDGAAGFRLRSHQILYLLSFFFPV